MDPAGAHCHLMLRYHNGHKCSSDGQMQREDEAIGNQNLAESAESSFPCTVRVAKPLTILR